MQQNPLRKYDLRCSSSDASGWQTGKADSNFKTPLEMIHHTTLAIFLSCVAGITKKDYRNVAAFHIIHPFFPTYVSGNATYLKEVQIEIQIWICFLNL